MEGNSFFRQAACLVLADGTVFSGESFGAQGETSGEVVFNTSMTGYQEIITDPSYKNQLVTMTYPLIGNYGVNEEDKESNRVWAQGFIVKEYSETYSNWQAKGSLSDYLKENNIVGICGIDTRALTQHIRVKGAMEAILSTKTDDLDRLKKQARQLKGLVGVDSVSAVTCKDKYTVSPDSSQPVNYTIAAYDFGIKKSILKNLATQGCRVIVVPASTSPDDVLTLNPDGIFLSNGPGDPAAVGYAIENIKSLIGKKPIFGICLGHQLLSLALGAKTFKLKFGHHGGNHPVKNIETGQVEITAQNHGFGVLPESIADNVIVTHTNLNDHTIEGIEHTTLPLFSVQYHPESSPGPHDSRYLFDRFITLIDQEQCR